MPVDPKLSDATMPSRNANTDAAKISSTRLALPPWIIQQHMNGAIDLDAELAARYPNMPLMSLIHVRALDGGRRGVAMLSTQDGAANVSAEADMDTRSLSLAFTHSSMLTLRFHLRNTSDLDRQTWVDATRREDGTSALLWGRNRWTSDYVVSASRKHFTNLYAFSPNQIEAAARVKSEVMRKLLDWLETFWNTPASDRGSLTTW